MRLCETHRLGGVTGCRDDQCVGCVIEEAELTLSREVSARDLTIRDLREELRQARDWEDVDDQWTEKIHAAHPARSGSHDTYATAMKMVGNRHSKGELVALVNWLLVKLGARERDPR
jgi:hypothetical protein